MFSFVLYNFLNHFIYITAYELNLIAFPILNSRKRTIILILKTNQNTKPPNFV